MKSIYDIAFNSHDGQPGFLEQYKGKVTLIVNTTVGCGNANQLGPLQRIHEKYQDQGFAVVAIPTNDYCGPGITYGEWVEGITCGTDSLNYGQKEYGVTFNYSEMINSIPDPTIKFPSGEVKVYGEPHELYKEIQSQIVAVNSKENALVDSGEIAPHAYISPELNRQFSGEWMHGNFEKYLVDKDGFVIDHFHCTILNADAEVTILKQALEEGTPPPIRNKEITDEMVEEEFTVVCEDIEKAINGNKSLLNR